MQRRQFLHNALALGAAGMLPNIGLANGFLGNLLQDVTPLHSNDANQAVDDEIWINKRGGELLTQEEVERLIDMLYLCPDLILVSEQKTVVALRYDEKTMIAPVVTTKDVSEWLLHKAVANDVPFASVEGQWVNFEFIKEMSKPLVSQIERHDWLGKLGYEATTMGHAGPQDVSSVIQDIYDNLDIDDVIPERHYTIIAETMAFANYLKQRKVNADRPAFHISHNFRLDGALVLVSGRGVTVALRYDAKTMIAPEVLGKGDAAPILEEYAKGISRVRTGVRVPSNSPFGERLHSLKGVRCFLVDEQEESVVQDLYDNLNVYDPIPDRHYECIADILERDDQAEHLYAKEYAKEHGILTQEEVERLLTGVPRNV